MAKVNYEGPEQFRPLGAWEYFGYSILYSIPLIGFIMLIIFSFNDSNINRRNFSRSFFCGLLVFIAVMATLVATGFFAQLSNQ
jgi:hypothetical protein